MLAAVHIADALMDPEPSMTGDSARQGKLDQVLLDQAVLAPKLPGAARASHACKPVGHKAAADSDATRVDDAIQYPDRPQSMSAHD